jgi:hypothetical protein
MAITLRCKARRVWVWPSLRGNYFRTIIKKIWMQTFVGMTNQEMVCRDASFRRKPESIAGKCNPPYVLNCYKEQSKLC